MDPLFGTPLSQVTLEQLERIKETAQENIFFDFKQELNLDPTNQKKDPRTEFLKDVSSFANAEGGLILYGVSERRDDEGGKTGEIDEILGCSISNIDDQMQKMTSLLRDGVDPPLSPLVNIEQLKIEEGKSVILVRIQKSFVAPHMVIHNKDYRCYSRANTQKEKMTMTQIRELVLGAEKRIEEIRQWIMHRWNNHPITSEKRWMLHYVPLRKGELLLPFAHESAKDILDRFRIPSVDGYASDAQTRFCFEGLRRLLVNSPEEQTTIYRNGVIEWTGGQYAIGEKDGRFQSWGVERACCKAIDDLVKISQDDLISIPGILSFNLSGVKDLSLVPGDQNNWEMNREYYEELGGYKHQISRSHIGPIEVEVLDARLNTEHLLKSILDVLWNCGNHPECPYFENGGLPSSHWLNQHIKTEYND